MRLRPLLLALALLAPAAARADLLYVLNSGDATVSILNAETRQEIRRIPMLREPHHLVLSPDGSQLVIADSGGNELLFFNPATGEQLRRERISNPYHLEYSPDGRFLVVASLRRDQVDLYEANTLTLLQRWRPGDMPSHVAFSPDSKRVFVTLQGDGAVAAFNLEERSHLWTAPVGPQPAGIIWHRGKLIVGIMGTDHFVTLDPDSRETAPAFAIGRGAHTIYPHPNGQALYATSRVDSRVAEIDPETLAVRRSWNIPGGPDCLAFDPDGRVWMTLRWAGRIGMIDPREAEPAVQTARVGRSPHGVFFKPIREGVRADFAQNLPGAVSGSRPLPAPMPPRSAAPSPGLPGPTTPAAIR